MSAPRVAPRAGTGDQAERYLFTALPELGARERRALALAELTDAGRETIAAEVGLSDRDLSAALAAARKALRRSHIALAAGGRCERTERLVSDALDGALTEDGRRRHDAHLERCPRCREHVAVLTSARAALHEGFAQSLTVEPAPIVAPAPAGPPKLRVVPAPPETVAAPQPAPAPAPQPAPEPEPQPEAAAVVPAQRDEPQQPAAPAPRSAAAPARAPHRTARRALTAALILLALVAALIGGVTALDGGGGNDARAPWDAPDAPDVTPAPLSGQ